MSHPLAAESLNSALPGVVESYRMGLLRLNSLLVLQPEAWDQCRRQAVTIIRECITSLEGDASPQATEPDGYTRLLRAHRALQRIPAAESIRAVEVLWSSLQPAVHAAATCEAPAHRMLVWQTVNSAFRRATSERLYAGTLSYDETRSRILAVGRERTPPVPHRDSGPSPATEEAGQQCDELTAREREVIDAVSQAMTNRQIAQQLGISEGTVKRHLSNIFGKLGASSRMDAVRKAAAS